RAGALFQPLVGDVRQLEAVALRLRRPRLETVPHRLQGEAREVVAVHRVHQIKDAGEAGARVLLLVPAAVRTLHPEQPLDAAAHDGIGDRGARREKAEDGPRGLRRRARALGLRGGIAVGAAAFAPAAVGVLDRAEPRGRLLDPAFTHVDADRAEADQHLPRAVQVV